MQVYFFLQRNEVQHMKQSMELNIETASRLWIKQFGKKQKTVYFFGRTIARGTYNDRNSESGEILFEEV